MKASDISTMAIEVVQTNEVHNIVGRYIIIFYSEVDCGTGVFSIFCK